jgi:hypothetical protein
MQLCVDLMHYITASVILSKGSLFAVQYCIYGNLLAAETLKLEYRLTYFLI